MVSEPEKFTEMVSILGLGKEGRAITSKCNDDEQWRISGVKFLKQKFFDQAIKCFTYSGDKSLVDRCVAF